MNKSERNALAAKVANMVYSFNTTPEVASSGDDLRRMFPAIVPTVELYRGIIAEENVTNCLRSGLLLIADYTVLNREIRLLVGELHEPLFEIVEAYFDAKKEEIGNYGDEHIFEIEDSFAHCVGSSPQFLAAVIKVVKDPQWQKTVADFYEPNSREYNFLTAVQSIDAE